MLYIRETSITMKAKLFFLLLFAITFNTALFASNPVPLSKSQDTTYWKAIKYYQDEEFNSSLLLFKSLLDSKPEDAEINYYVGMCYYNLDKPKLAKLHFSIAVNDNICRLKIILLTRDSNTEGDLISYNQ